MLDVETQFHVCSIVSVQTLCCSSSQSPLDAAEELLLTDYTTMSVYFKWTVHPKIDVCFQKS